MVGSCKLRELVFLEGRLQVELNSRVTVLSRFIFQNICYALQKPYVLSRDLRLPVYIVADFQVSRKKQLH